MKKWIALGIGLTSLAVTATTAITQKDKIRSYINTKKQTKTPSRTSWLPFTKGPAFTSSDDIGWVNG